MKFVEKHETGCVFCDIQAQSRDTENMIIFRGKEAFVLLNRYPYTSGHLMVVAKFHQPSFEDLNAGTRSEMMELATKGLQILRKIYKPDAFNFGANIGEAAGAGVAGHVHLHVVPRWSGDTSFMSILGDTRVLPEELEETYHRVHIAWNGT
jgi:ATP adenylyltransferase